jgi:hypothetical protein
MPRRHLELLENHGIELPETPPMAVHRGRIDRLEKHLRRDPDLLTRTFTHQAIHPSELGCHADESLALHGTPLGGTTLLHLCVDNDEVEIARWLLEKGADVDARRRVGGGGRMGYKLSKRSWTRWQRLAERDRRAYPAVLPP